MQHGCTKPAPCPGDQFQRAVDKHLTGKDTEPTEIIDFKLYQSQVPVIEQAIETAALMLGTYKSRGDCLEMICADFFVRRTPKASSRASVLRRGRLFWIACAAIMRSNGAA